MLPKVAGAGGMGSLGQAADSAAEDPEWVPGPPEALRLSRHRRVSGRLCPPAEMTTLRSTIPLRSGECRSVPHKQMNPTHFNPRNCRARLPSRTIEGGIETHPEMATVRCSPSLCRDPCAQHAVAPAQSCLPRHSQITSSLPSSATTFPWKFGAHSRDCSP